jgi:hypothetical protein
MTKEVARTGSKKENRCLACGTTEKMKNRKYCSIRCRQILRQKLNTRCGLLQVLNTRYATFYFSDEDVIMDVLPRGSQEVFRFSHIRSKGHKPGDDFSRLADLLGRAWWAEEKRTGRKYLASRHILEMATKHETTLQSFRPRQIKFPSTKNKYLEYLAVEKTQLSSPDLRKVIKNAYRRQAKIHHPDTGGNAVTFRKIHDAYRELLRWAENPNFIKRRGFPDKWFYDGENNRWVQPMQLRSEG